MRTHVAFILGSAALFACGELATVPPQSDRSSLEPRVEVGETEGSATRSTPAAPATPEADESEFPAPTWGPDPTGCFLDDGPDAPGECEVGEVRACPEELRARYATSSSSSGVSGVTCDQRCVNVKGAARWSEPTTSTQCPWYDTNLKVVTSATGCGCMTPLVLAFDDQRVIFDTTATGSFDLTPNHISHGSDWPTAATPWLALDRDGNGSIDDGSELFGSASPLAAGGYAKNGFEALRDLDENRDGVFDANDAAYAKIVVWSDRNADRLSTPNELTTLAEAGVASIDLHDRRELHCDARMNCEGERSRFTSTTGKRGTVVDVYLPLR